MDTAIIVALIGATGGIFGLLGTIAGSFLGGWQARQTALSTALDLADLERAKYTRDRLWEERKTTYGQMISNVTRLLREASELSDTLWDEEIPPEAIYAQEYFTKAAADFWKGWRQAHLEFDAGKLFLSEDFIVRFGKLASTIYGEEDDDPPIQYAATVTALESAAAELLAIARAEIAPVFPTELSAKK